ncbi:unnamed protein product [Rhizoctonia solani]|uniref:Uncharacterized protein n=1 Tax=Rhizoctonia solani TaxID=456999 RepID=A0A8H3DPM6_9AGAM|nr:unnamed protein product [Rhizoctonia solani]CAE6534991.1 unnamed protein product [Rhizoctonia solani]
MAIRSAGLVDGHSRADECAVGGLRQLSRPDGCKRAGRGDQEQEDNFSWGVDPGLSMGRIVVQGSWRLAALIYLARSLVRACSPTLMCGELGAMRRGFEKRTSDQGSLQAYKGYARVEPRRIPDSFLVLPMLILGIPAPVKERKLIRERMLDLMECSRPNTLGNKMPRILDGIWARADERGRAGSRV